MKRINRNCLTPLAVLISMTLSGTAAGENIGSQYGTSIVLNDGDVLTGDSLYSGGLYGIMNPYPDTGKIALGKHSVINVTDEDNYARGVIIWGRNSTLNADDLEVNVSGDRANGINLIGSKVIADLGTGSRINVTGTGDSVASGIKVEVGSSLTADRLSITTKGYNGIGLAVENGGSSADLGTGSIITTSGNHSNGILVDALNGPSAGSLSTLKADQLSVTTQGEFSYGIELQENTAADLGSGTSVLTSGAGATGIFGMGELSASNLTIATTGSEAIALEIRLKGVADIGADSHVSSAQAGGIVASGTHAVINYSGTADKRNTITAGGSYAASAQTSTSQVNLAETDIVSQKMGLWAINGGTITGNNLSIDNASPQYAAVYAMTNSEVDLTGDTTITVPFSDYYALATQDDAGYAASRIKLEGKVNMKGSVYADGGQIDLTLTPGSVWEGSAFSNGVNQGYLNASLDDSLWNVSANSNLDLLALNNSSVDFTHPSSSAEGFTTLTAADLQGSGNFNMRVDLVGEGDGVNNSGDKLVVTNSSAGNYTLSFANQGSMATTGNETLTVVETADGMANFKAASDVELGGYLYTVHKVGTDWALYSSGVAPEPTPAPTPEPTPAPTPEPTPAPAPEPTPAPAPEPTPAPTPEPTPAPAPEPTPAPTPEPTPAPANGGNTITTTADAGANFLHVGYLLNYAETQTLLQRMGDIRQSKNSGNVWLRGFGGKFDSFPGGKLSQFSMSYSGYQFGVDKNIAEDQNLFAGLFMGATTASPNYRGGDGSAESQHFGAYLTWVADNGFYIDQLIKFDRLSNQFSVKDSQNNSVAGTGKTSGFSAAIEAGKRFSFAPDNQGFYLEPQMQLTAGKQKGTEIKASNGLRISFKDYDSVIGRVSALAGYSSDTEAGQLNVYYKTGIVREFSANTEYRLNGSPEKNDFRGNWWNNGIGVSASLNKTHNFYLEADLSTGHRFNQRQVNAGYRFSF